MNAPHIVGSLVALLVVGGVAQAQDAPDAKKTQRLERENRRLKLAQKHLEGRIKELTREVVGMRRLLTGDGSRSVKPAVVRITSNQKGAEELLQRVHTKLELPRMSRWLRLPPQDRERLAKLFSYPRRKQSKTRPLLDTAQETFQTLQVVVPMLSGLNALRERLSKDLDSLRERYESSRRRYQGSINGLRRKIVQLEDDGLDMARNADVTKKRLQDENQEVRAELAKRIKTHLAAAARARQEQARRDERIVRLRTRVQRQLARSLRSQQVTMRVRDAPVRDVLVQLARQTGFRHTLSTLDERRVRARITLPDRPALLKGVLDQVCKQTGLRWRREGEHVRLLHPGGLVKSRSGLVWHDVTRGEGRGVPTKGQVYVRRVTYLEDGTELARGEVKVDLPKDTDHPALVEGVATMKVGGRRTLLIPPSLAGSKPPAKNATLVVRLDLVDIEKAGEGGDDDDDDDDE